MATTNPGQFGKRSDTKKQASIGGKMSSGSISDSKTASKMGKLGNVAQPLEAKKRGGRNSHR